MDETCAAFFSLRRMPNPPTQQKNIVLYIGIPNVRTAISDVKRTKEGKRYRYAIMHNVSQPTPAQHKTLEAFDIELCVSFDKPRSITDALKPYEDHMCAVTCRSEYNIPYFQKVIPHVPYVRTPTIASLEWATDKIKMRRRFMSYDRSITPDFKVVMDATKRTVKDIEKRLRFPVVIKPSGLATSLLVTVAYHHEELQSSLKRVFRKIHKLIRENRKDDGDAKVLVEQFMEGAMYSVDAFVSSRGKVYFCPMVYIKTGREVGFDDFFAYQTITPTALTKKSVEDAHHTATQAIRALGLRSTSAHIEMLKTEHGWRVIEVGPRLGGLRTTMYWLSYGINLPLNDFLIRIPRKPIIYNRKKGYTAVIKFFPKQEGVITKLTGVKKAQELKSFYAIHKKKKVGQRAYFAKHGGKDVCNVTLFNKDRSKLLADVRRLEKTVEIETAPTARKAEERRIKANGKSPSRRPVGKRAERKKKAGR